MQRPFGVYFFPKHHVIFKTNMLVTQPEERDDASGGPWGTPEIAVVFLWRFNAVLSWNAKLFCGCWVRATTVVYSSSSCVPLFFRTHRQKGESNSHHQLLKPDSFVPSVSSPPCRAKNPDRGPRKVISEIGYSGFFRENSSVPQASSGCHDTFTSQRVPSLQLHLSPDGLSASRKIPLRVRSTAFIRGRREKGDHVVSRAFLACRPCPGAALLHIDTCEAGSSPRRRVSAKSQQPEHHMCFFFFARSSIDVYPQPGLPPFATDDAHFFVWWMSTSSQDAGRCGSTVQTSGGGGVDYAFAGHLCMWASSSVGFRASHSAVPARAGTDDWKIGTKKNELFSPSTIETILCCRLQ